MNETLKKIVAVLETGRPELQVAAAQMLGEIGDTSDAIVDALVAHLRRDEAFLTPFVLDALSRLATPRAVAALVDKLQLGGATADRVAHLLGTMGKPATAALAKVFGDGDAELQARVVSILGKDPDKAAVGVLLSATLSADAQLSALAAQTLAEALPTLGEAETERLVSGIDEALAAGDDSHSPEALSQALALLARVDAAANRATLLRFATTKHAPMVRKVALEGLAGVELTPAQSKTVLAYIEEQDMTHVVRPAIACLDGTVKWPAPALASLEQLLSNRREERRLFALRALVEHPTPAMSKQCLKFLLNGAEEFQDAAVAALGNNPDALPDVIKAFQNEKTLERSRLLARAVVALGAHIDGDIRRGMVDRAAKLVQAGEPAGDVILQTVAGLGEVGADAIVDKAVRLRRTKKFQEAAAILVRLAQFGEMPDEGHYQLAVNRLILDQLEAQKATLTEDHDEDAAGANGDATMGYFAVLVREGFNLTERLKKESQVAPEALLRVGRHFAEGVATERRFGADLLEYVANKHSRVRAGEEARLIMRSEGL